MLTLHLLAGPNGAGKTTLHQSLVAPRYPGLPFVNADQFEAEHLGLVASPSSRSALARAWADAERAALLKRRESFATETVFSHPSKLELMAQARSQGCAIALYIVCVDDPGLLLERVKQRVAEGGHAVPVHKVLTRYPRTLALLQEALVFADLSLLFDGADAQAGGPKLIASVAAGTMHLHTPLRPRWAEKLLGFAEA
jgi:predicted ABC-type ATPase